MNIHDLEKVTQLEKSLKKIRYIRQLVREGFSPHLGIKNSHREDVNFYLPNTLAYEILDSQETIIVKCLAELGVTLGDPDVFQDHAEEPLVL